MNLIQFRCDGVYLITGGTGGIGQVVARWMVERGAKKLALVSRRGAQSLAAQRMVEDLRGMGADVSVYQADAADFEGLKGVLDTIQAASGPLRGVIHAAGVNEDGVILQQDWKRFERVVASKASSAWNLHLLTRHIPLDMFVLFSSIAGPFGSQGQSNYSAANTFLQAVAHARRAEGLPALCLDWGAWDAVGMTARLNEHNQQELLRRGLDWITPEVAVRAFEQALSQPRTEQLILAVKWAEYLEHIQSASQSFFERIAERGRTRTVHQSSAVQTGQVKDSGPSELVRRFLETPTSRRKAYLILQIQQAVARLVGFPLDTAIDPQTPLNTLGLDSLMAVEMRNYLSQSLGTSLPATLLFDYPTSDTLSAYLLSSVPALQTQGEDIAAEDAASDTAPASTETRNVQDLTDEEAEAELLAELRKGQAHD